MNDPWQILILDRHTATEKDVKAAYARLLKQHRPDSDPEGFRRVREAYETALDWLRHRASQVLPEVSYVEAPMDGDGAKESAAQDRNRPDPPVVFEDFPLPEEAQEALNEVDLAARSGNTEQIEAALMTFHNRCEAAGVSGMSRATALERALQGQVNAMASAVTDSFLIRMAEQGQMHLPHLVVSAWQDADDRERMVQFSRALLEHTRPLGTPEGAVLLARMGVLTGLEQPEMASALANAAYPHLPVDARNHLMAQLEQEAALGKIFAEVSPSMKPFWFKRMREGVDGFDWNSAEARNAINNIVERNRYVWEGWGIVRQLMPEKTWALVENRLRYQAQQAASSQPRSSGFPGWLVVPLILVVINMLRFMANDRPSSRTYSEPVPSSSAATWSVTPDKLRPENFHPSLTMEDLLGGKKPSVETPSTPGNASRIPVDIRTVPPVSGPNWQKGPGEKYHNPYKDPSPYSIYELPILPGVDASTPAPTPEAGALPALPVSETETR